MKHDNVSCVRCFINGGDAVATPTIAGRRHYALPTAGRRRYTNDGGTPSLQCAEMLPISFRDASPGDDRRTGGGVLQRIVVLEDNAEMLSHSI